MSAYHPDSWVVLKVKEGKGTFPFYKVLAGWSGGYLDGDSWRMNSGITKVEIYGEHYIFHGESGSEYWCHIETCGLRMSTAGVYKDLCLQQEFKGQIILMPEDTKWTQVKWCNE
jgi:hypothetical protein|tara:strand:+ start:431 stop:772 length:342 start_codon:yes stop_codon:yes gene_type:complete